MDMTNTGAYAHVGLPGLRELVNGVSPKPEGEIDRLKTENEEKDAEINELKDELDRINNHLFNACKEIERLRKALEEAKENIRLIETKEIPSLVTSYCDMAIEEIDAALGEGDTQ